MSAPEAIATDDGADRADGARLAHDLRGPLLNIEGFAAEIALGFEELERLLDQAAPADAVIVRLGALLDEDLRPCLDFLERAATMLHARIDALEPTAEGPDGP